MENYDLTLPTPETVIFLQVFLIFFEERLSRLSSGLNVPD